MNSPLLVLLVQSKCDSLEKIRAQVRADDGAPFVFERVTTLAQALDISTREHAAAILLDLDLPDTQDLDAFITLQLRAPEMPIVVFGETLSTAQGLAAVRAGAQDYLTRAEIETPLVERALRNAIERQRIRSAAYSHAEQLQFSEARFRLLINENADAILVVSHAGVVRFANPAAASLFGQAREQLVGASFPLPLGAENESMSITRGSETLITQPRVVRALWSGEEIYIVTLRDVTEERMAQEQLRRAQAREQHQREMAQALADSAMVLNSTLSFEQVLDQILENVGRVVPHDAASIFLMAEGIGRFVRGKGFAERALQELMESMQLRINEVPGYEWMARTGKPLLIPDTAAYAEWKDLTGGWIRSYLGAPLRVQDETIGFLSLDSATRGFFNVEHLVDLQAFAAQAATALENARLHAHVQRRADEFAALYELTRELAMQRELDTLLVTLLEGAMKLLNAPCGVLALYLPQTQELQVRVVRGDEQLGQDVRMALGDGLMGRVALTQQPILLEDYRKWELRLPRLLKSNVSAVVCVPMLFGGELVGALAVHEEGDTTRRFAPADAQLLSLLATQAAVLVHNARLHDETEKRAQQMALLYDAGLTLNSVLEPKTQLDFLTRIAMRSVRGDLAVFFRFNEMARELVLEFGLGYSQEFPFVYAQRVLLDAPQGVEAWVARERVPAVLNDTHADPRFLVTDDLLLSGVWVPIEHDKRLLGVLAVGSRERNRFTAHDERLLLLFASQAAVAMENARLYSSALLANERRAVLHWASQEIIRAGLDAERVYAAIHRAASRLMPCEAFVIAVLDDKQEQIELPYLIDRGGRQPVGKIPRDKGLSGYVLERGACLVIDELAATDVPLIHFGYPEQVVSVLAVPLQHGGQVFGMLSAQSYEKNAYSADDCAMLEMLAAHAAAALLNLRGAS